LFDAVKTELEQDNDLKGSKFYGDNGPYLEKSVNGVLYAQNRSKCSKWAF
jgi:hypothetical protein